MKKRSDELLDVCWRMERTREDLRRLAPDEVVLASMLFETLKSKALIAARREAEERIAREMSGPQQLALFSSEGMDP